MNKFRIVIELDTYSSDPSEWVMEAVSEVVGDQLEEDETLELVKVERTS